MPTMTSNMLTNAQDLKALILTAKDAIDAAQAKADSLMTKMYAVNTGTTADIAAAHVAGNAVMDLKAAFKRCRADLDSAHATVSTAAIVYDPANGIDLVHYAPTSGGGGGR